MKTQLIPYSKPAKELVVGEQIAFGFHCSLHTITKIEPTTAACFINVSTSFAHSVETWKPIDIIFHEDQLVVVFEPASSQN